MRSGQIYMCHGQHMVERTHAAENTCVLCVHQHVDTHHLAFYLFPFCCVLAAIGHGLQRVRTVVAACVVCTQHQCRFVWLLVTKVCVAFGNNNEHENKRNHYELKCTSRPCLPRTAFISTSKRDVYVCTA